MSKLTDQLAAIERALAELLATREAAAAAGKRLQKACDAFEEHVERLKDEHADELERRGLLDQIFGDKRYDQLNELYELTPSAGEGAEVTQLWDAATWRQLSGSIRSGITHCRKALKVLGLD